MPVIPALGKQTIISLKPSWAHSKYQGQPKLQSEILSPNKTKQKTKVKQTNFKGQGFKWCRVILSNYVN